MTEVRRPLSLGEFVTPAAAEFRLRICNHELLTRALDFAHDRLGNIPRKHPYPSEKSLYDHSAEVGAVVQSMFPIDNDPLTSDPVINDRHATIIATAVLHDVVEDSGVEYDDLVREFGEEVAQGVSMLSEDNRISFVERKKRYLAQFEDPTTPDHIVAISLADKFINVRDMNKVYDALINQYKDPRLAKALHYGAFWTPPAEAVQFYRNHSTIMHNQLDADPHYGRLLKKYDHAREKWQNSLTTPERYDEVILPDPSYKVRELALTGADAINARLEALDAPMRVIVGGSTAYGSAVRQVETNGVGHSTLHNIDLIFYPANHRGQLEQPEANIERFIDEDTIHQQIEALRKAVEGYCLENGIEHLEDDSMVSFFWPEQ